MYELRLTKNQKQKFVNVVRYRLAHNDMTLKDLAEQIGRPVNTVYNFMSHDNRANRFLAAEIAEKLEMKPEEWRC